MKPLPGMPSLLVVLGAVVLSSVQVTGRLRAAETGEVDGAALFAAEAGELTANCRTRIDKLVALHAFVRDEIRQVATKYG